MASEPPKYNDEFTDEISVLIKALLDVDQRLEELTDGQVDSVTDRDGRTFLLQRAQAEKRYVEAARQVAVLNALPAYVILLNCDGRIVSVNDAWRHLTCHTVLLDGSYDDGTDYLRRCDAASTGDFAYVHEVAAGIRSVLDGSVSRFTSEYHFFYEGQSYWHLLSVTPLQKAHPLGVVVMYLDITERKVGEQQSRRFTVAMDSMEDAIFLSDRKTMRVIHVNDAACRLQKQTREELMNFRPVSVLGLSGTQLEAIYDEVILSRVPIKPVEHMLTQPDGSKLWVEVRRHAHLTLEGWTITSVVRDVTERKFYEDRIAYLNRVYAMLTGINTLIVRSSARDELCKEACRIAVIEGGFPLAVIAMFDPSGNLVPVGLFGRSQKIVAMVLSHFSASGDMACAMTTVATAEKRAVVSNKPSTRSNSVFAAMRRECGTVAMATFPLIIGQTVVGLLTLYAAEGQYFHSDEVKLLTGLTNDIASAVAHIDKKERLDYLAYYDLLTGLANRKLFLERVGQSIVSKVASDHKVAVLLFDLRRFRDINDTLGRAVGDVLLKQVAEWLIGNFGERNFLARVGVDQFSLLMPDIALIGDLSRLLETTLTAFLNHSFVLEGAPFRIVVVVGVALFPEDGADADTLFKHAEAALKKAKAGGDRYLFYNQKMSASLAGRLTLENQMHRALGNEEFDLYYQPKMNLATGLVSGAEALIRWNDPDQGLVLPDRFIPILEDTGLIHEVGRWALRRAIQDSLRWRLAGHAAMRVAVNVSPLQLRSPTFVSEIEQALSGNFYAASGLELEITESLIMDDIKGNIASLQVIRNLGVTIAIDDFGTGFSSLSYLAKLPVHTLKIDRSFIIDMITGPEGLVLVSAIVKLAHSLGLKVVAEGVETEQQSRLLRLLKCDEMQGYLVSKPMPVAAFEAKYLTPV